MITSKTNKNIKSIAEKLSSDVLIEIQNACNLAHESGFKICSTLFLFKTLTLNSYIKLFLDQIQFNYHDLLNEIEPLLKSCQYPFNIHSDVTIFSPDLKETILRSFEISKNYIINKIGLEDIFLSTLYSPEIYRLIKKLNISINSLEEFIITIKGKSQKSDLKESPILRFTIDLIQKAKDNKITEVIDRQIEFSQLIRILTRQEKNNSILVGETGVGKSSIVNLLALNLIKGDIPFQLKNAKLLEFNLANFMSTIVSRNIEDMIELLKDEIKALDNAIIFIKNFDFLVQNVNLEYTIFINTIKSLLNSQNIRFIISTTSSSYKNLTSYDNSFLKYFEVIKINEPASDVILSIIKKASERLSEFHKITINNDVISVCIMLSKRYIQDKFLPTKAIDLLDECCSKVVLENRKELSVEDIKSVISEKTGIPIEKLTVSEQKKLIDLENILNEKIIGQKEAVHIVSEVVRRSRAGLKDPQKPIGSFLFLGPSGVGKTFLAQNLTKIVYDNDNAMIRLDMSEFSESHTVQRLIGSPPGYVGYEEGGQLTNPIWEKPYSLILLDEIEKAHPKVFDIFLQVLDEGRLTDGQGRTVDFKNTILIATSNIASEEILYKYTDSNKGITGFEREQFLEKEILPILKQHFRTEFINRFDEIIIFNPLGIEELKLIAKLQIEKIKERLSDKKIEIIVSDQKVSQLIQSSYKPAFGARPLIRTLQDQIENVLAKKIISGEIKEGETVTF